MKDLKSLEIILISSNPPTGIGYIFYEKVGSTRIKIKILIGKVMTGRPSSKIKKLKN